MVKVLAKITPMMVSSNAGVMTMLKHHLRRALVGTSKCTCSFTVFRSFWRFALQPVRAPPTSHESALAATAYKVRWMAS